MTKNPTDTMFKPGYEGERPKGTLSAPERQALREVKHAVVDRLHTAMLTLNAMQGVGPAQLRAAGCPPHLVEFADRVGEEAQEVERARFKPTPTDVSDMPKALALLDGLRKPYYTVVKLRALDTFARENDESGPWPWDRIGDVFGLSALWAEEVYNAAIVQACRRAGVLPMVSLDHAVLLAAVWISGGWLTNISTSPEPRAALQNLKGKSPIRLEQAVAIWLPRAEVAKSIADKIRSANRGAASHGSWYKLNPEALEADVVAAARSLNAAWMVEDLPVRSALAA